MKRSLVGLGLLMLACVGPLTAQEPACVYYRVTTGLPNISKDLGGLIYVDVLETGEIVCISRRQPVEGSDWGFIAHKLDRANANVPVGGWTALSALAELSAGETSYLGLPAPAAGAAPAVAQPAPASLPAAPAQPPAPPQAAPPPVATLAPAPSATPSPPTPPAATAAAQAGASRPAVDTRRFNQPIPFGPVPVNGRTVEELANGIPLFPPIEGLEESLWQKSCTSCHKWDRSLLCEQGRTYAKAARHILRHPHPYGGAYKIALMRWAKSGCE